MGGALLHTWATTPPTKFPIVQSYVLMCNGIPTKILSQNIQKLTANLECSAPPHTLIHSKAYVDTFFTTPQKRRTKKIGVWIVWYNLWHIMSFSALVFVHVSTGCARPARLTGGNIANFQ